MARVVVPGLPHHITQRGNRKQNVFFEEEDYMAYKNLMREHCDKFGVEIWTYCLMPNHIHLIAVPKNEESLARGIGEAHRKYTRMINFRNDWRGYLWQGRFFSTPMNEHYLYAAIRYIELNPVRSGLVADPGKYKWSSALAHLKRKEDILLSPQKVVDISKWNTFLREDLSQADIDTIRRHARTGRPLGGEGLLTQIEAETGRDLHKKKPGPKGPWKYKSQ